MQQRRLSLYFSSWSRSTHRYTSVHAVEVHIVILRFMRRSIWLYRLKATDYTKLRCLHKFCANSQTNWDEPEGYNNGLLTFHLCTQLLYPYGSIWDSWSTTWLESSPYVLLLLVILSPPRELRAVWFDAHRWECHCSNVCHTQSLWTVNKW